MDHLDCASVHIVGNSAGGYLGQQLAMNQGERVRSLMLFGSTPGLKNSQAPSWIPQIEAKGLRAFLAETIADRLPLDQVDPGLVEWFLDEAAKNDPAYIGKFVLLMASYDWSDQLHRIECPALVVVPGAEPIGSTANYEPFRRHVRDVEMRVYEGAPHNICDAFPTAAPAMCSISSAAASGSASEPAATDYSTMSAFVLSTNPNTAARSGAATVNLSRAASRCLMKACQSLSLIPNPLWEIFMSRPE